MLSLKTKAFCLLLAISMFIVLSDIGAHPSDPSSLMSNYSLYGKDSLIIEEHTITSDVGWVGTDNLFKIIGNWAEEFGSLVKVGNTFNGGGGTATYHDTVYVKGSLTGGLPPADLLINPATFPDPLFPDFEANEINIDPSNDVIIENNTVNIEPGSYGTINIGANNSNASIGVFKAGLYEVDTLIVWGSLQIDKDSLDYCRILVKSHFSIGSSSQNNHVVVKNESFGRVLIHTTAEGSMVINPHTRIDATLMAPKMDIKVNSDVTLNGQLLAQSIITGQDFNGNTGIFTSFITTGVTVLTRSINEDPNDVAKDSEPVSDRRNRLVPLVVRLDDVNNDGGSVKYRILPGKNGSPAKIGEDFDTLSSLGASGSGVLTFQPNAKYPDTLPNVYIYDDVYNDSTEYFTVELYEPSQTLLLKNKADSASWDVAIKNEDILPDTGTIDTGTIDTGTIDTGTIDTGTIDTGTIDTGTIDTSEHSINAKDDVIFVAEGETVVELANGVLSILVNDESTDPPIIVSAIVTPPDKGTLQLDSSGTFSYTHTSSGGGTDSFVYEITDAYNQKDSAVVTINIQISNKYDPVALNDTITVLEGSSVDTLVNGQNSVLYNDSDLDAMDSILTASVINSASHGVLIFNSNGTFEYTHDGSEYLSDAFNYVVTDNSGNTDTATVSIVVEAVNDHKPVAGDDLIFVQPGETVYTLANGDSSLFDNDSDLDPGDTISMFSLTVGDFGTMSMTSANLLDGKFAFHLNDTCTDSLYTFTYVIKDLAGNKDTATVYVTTVFKADENDPIATNDSIIVNEGATATTLTNGSSTVLFNDIDPDSPIDMLKTSLLDTAVYGTITLNVNGTFSYTHNGSENFTDSFKYLVTDAAGQIDTGIVYIVINSVNDNSPIANPEDIIVFKGENVQVTSTGDSSVLANDSDLDGMTNVKVILVSDVSSGTLILDSLTGKFSYTHDGTDTYVDSFTYKLNDGVQDGNVVTVNIKILDNDIGNTIISSAYYDGDGNGVIDTVVINLAAPVSSSTLSLNVEWVGESKNGSTLNIVAKTTTQLVADISGAFSDTLYDKTSGTLKTEVIIGSDTFSSIAKDSAAPVLTFARLVFAEDETKNDNLIVEFSEDMNSISSKNPFVFYTPQNESYLIDLTFIELLPDDQYKFEIDVIEFGFTPSSLDSVNINFEASVSDVKGVIQDIELNKKVRLSLKIEPIKIDIISIVSDTIPEDLKISDDISIGSVVILDPVTDNNNEGLANDLIASSTYKAIVFDMVGNIVAECKGKDDTDSDLAIEVKTIKGKKKLVANWSNKNLKGRKVGSGSYLLIIQMENSEYNKPYKAFMTVKSFK